MRDTQKRDVARRLRGNMTDAEQCLWRYLRQRQVAGQRFRRQYPIGPYIVDFACVEHRLIIEVDGGQHADSETDVRRGRYLAVAGYVALRFWNHDVLGNIEGVVSEISRTLPGASLITAFPPQGGEKA